MRFIHRQHSAGANHGEIALHLLPEGRAVVQRRGGASQEFDAHEAAFESAASEATRYPEKDGGAIYVILHDGTQWLENWTYKLEA